MAFSSILRRSARLALTVRAIGSQRYNHHCPAIFSSTVNSRSDQVFFWSSFPSFFRHFSTSRPSSDESLIRVLESEIQCAEESDEQHKEAAPKGFPFTIQDSQGEQTISLTREYQGETIDVEVHMPDLLTGEDDDNKDDDNDDDTEKGNRSHLPLIVRVSKKEGPCLEFGVTAYADEIAIESLSIKDPKIAEGQIAYEGPSFSDLDENLQKAFHKYLENRGIKPSTANFLHEYMIDKDNREYLMWLNNLKNFVES